MARDMIDQLPTLDRLWTATRGVQDVCIAVLDGPVDLTHPCFAGSDLTRLETLVTEEACKGAAGQHGTHVASVIFGQPGSPVEGIAPACRGLIAPVFTSAADGALAPCSQIDLARAITASVERGAQIINISGGELADPQAADHRLINAVRLCAEQGVLIVAAAGNDGCRCLHVPAALPSVLAVGAMSADGALLGFSNWGDTYHRQGILAPGERIPGAVPGGGTALRSGTSYATPIVTGVAALLLSLQLHHRQKPDPRAVRNALLESAIGCQNRWAPDCERLLVGRLNIPGAVSRVIAKGEIMEMADQADVLVDATIPAGGVSASCGCGCAKTPSIVYALGSLDVDFGSEARRDSFIQQGVANPDDPAQLLAHLNAHPESAEGVLWVLTQETTPIYALQPEGPFARETYARLREFLAQQQTEGVETISVPGHVAGGVRLLNGQVVPAVRPVLRGLYSWSTSTLVHSLLGTETREAGDGQFQARVADVANFLERVYYELRNLGLSPQERALNFAATNAFQVERVYQSAIAESLKLSVIEVARSPICRPASDCWDVQLTFFDPLRRLERARVVYRFTVDVSDVVPVTVGTIRSWFVR